MSRTTNDSDDGMVSKDQVDSPSIDEGNNAGGSVGGIVLKKGPWTSAEDAILVDYVKKHGEGNWNAVQKHSGLFRCGKSCRLRWANHLRPNLKKGAFTPEEERLIIELHAKMGNKWARMAAHLPGRTDNEIKNYWNTRIKRLQRAGLPLYPPDVCLQALNDAQQNQNASEFSSEDIQPHDLLQSNGFDIPDVVFENYHVNMGTFPYGTEFQEIPVNGMLSQGLVPAQSYSFMPPTVPLTKKIREETLHPSFSGIICDELSPFQQFQNEGCEKIHHRPFVLGNSFPFDPDPNDKNFAPITGVTTGSHGLFHGNISASKSLVGTVKRELPSLQYPDTDLSTWANICPPSSPSLEAVDTYIQSPSQTEPMQSDSASPCNSGLLDALLQQAQTLRSEKNQSAEKRSASVVTPADFMDSTELNESETEWEYGDPISPLGRSAASVFSECTPPISGSSLDEPPHDKAMFRPGILKNSVEPVTTPDGEREISTRMDFTRPDALLNADWFHQSECMKDIEPFLNEVYCGDYKHLASGTTSNHSQGWGIASYPWNNMPAVCHISENP